MSFAYKKLNPADIKSVPYIANKQYEYDSSSYSDNNIQTYVGEYIPITIDQPFDAINDNLTTDQNYRRLIFESIRHLYYQNYITASSIDQTPESEGLEFPLNVNNFWHSSSFDNYLQNTLASGSFPNYRNFPYFQSQEFDYDNEGNALYGTAIYFIENSAKIRVISIPKDKYSEGIKPTTFAISGSDYFIADDGQGNLFDFIKVIAKYGDVFYSATPAYYAGKADGLVIPVGNIFYNHGLAVITNQDYLCFIEGNPVARNDYYTILNTQEEKILNIINADFDDCVSIASESVLTSNVSDFTFPDFSVSGSGDLIITPNLTSATPGQYKLNYTVNNTLGITSNTASITLNINAEPLTSSINSISESCFGGNDSASVTFSIDKGIPPYSWSIDDLNYTPSNDLFQPILSASLFPTRSLVLYIKDNEGNKVTQSLNTSFIPISGTVFQNEVSFCDTDDGQIIISASGAEGIISASLTSSFSNSVALPNSYSLLTEGSYTVYFKDSNLCTSSSTITVGKISPVTASYGLTHVDCFTSNSGQILLDVLDTNDTASDSFITGGREPLSWSWSGPSGFTTTSIDANNLVSGTYELYIFDNDNCNYFFSYEITSSEEIKYTASINYSSSVYTALDITNLSGSSVEYNYILSTSQSIITGSVTTGSNNIILDQIGLNSGSASLTITDTLGCQASTSSLEIYGRIWEVSESFCEDGTGSVAARNLNFYTNNNAGGEWVTVRIHSGSESPVEVATSGSATGSYTWNNNSTLYLDIFTGSNNNFSLIREFSGSSDVLNYPANLTGSEVTNSAIITGSGRMDYFYENKDVSLSFGTSHSISSLHLTASKVNTEELVTNINFKFDKTIDLKEIRDNFTGSAINLSLTGSGGGNIADGSGSNFIARDNEFTDTIYGNTGSFIGPNNLLFREEYPFGNIINTPSGSNVEFTNGKIFSGSVSASYFGSNNAQYFTQRTDKAWLMTADIDGIPFIEAYSYVDPINSILVENTTGSYKGYNVFAGAQSGTSGSLRELDLMYLMIIHEDEFANMPLPTGIGSDAIFSRRLNLIRDVNRVYYLFMSPTGSSTFPSDLNDRALAIGQYFIDNVING